MIIRNDKEFELYKEEISKKWKPIFDEEREKSGDISNAIRKNFAEYHADMEPIWGYALILDITGKIRKNADTKEN